MREANRQHTTANVAKAEKSSFILAVGYICCDHALRVGKSELLPAGGPAVLANNRSRLRAGLDWHGGSTEVFYGVTWLSKEFEAQGSGQLVGSLHARIRF